MLRLYGIRHARWLWHVWRLSVWLRLWQPYGYTVPSPEDLKYLDAIWKGKA